MAVAESAVGSATGHDYEGRLARLRERMSAQGVDYVFVAPSADLLYLTGLHMGTSERLAVLVVSKDGPSYMVLPFFEVEGWGVMKGGIQVLSWQETESPTKKIAETLGDTTGKVAAVTDQLHAAFLLRLQADMPGVRFIEASETLTPLRMVKDAYEVGLLRKAGRVGDVVFEGIKTLRFSGRTEREVGADIAKMLLDNGVASIIWGPIVGSGPNGANPHHTASDRVIQEGDLVVLDYGGYVNDYELDTTRTVAVGHAPEGEELAIYNLVQAGQEAAYQAAKPGITGAQLDSVTRDMFTAQGYGAQFTHRLGHGLGLDGHEPPYIVQGNNVPLEAGNVHSIEPGIYIVGKYGVRIEDIVVITENGAERFNNATRDLVVVQ